MKMAIISDIHDNLPNLRKCLEWCKTNQIESVICCGDVTGYETLTILCEEFEGPIKLVRGNVELYTEGEVSSKESFPNLDYYGKTGRFEIEGKFYGACHEPFLIENVHKLGSCEMIFYGHTHKPWIEKKDGYTSVNPGTLGGVFQKATFAILDTASLKLELKLLELL